MSKWEYGDRKRIISRHPVKMWRMRYFTVKSMYKWIEQFSFPPVFPLTWFYFLRFDSITPRRHTRFPLPQWCTLCLWFAEWHLNKPSPLLFAFWFLKYLHMPEQYEIRNTNVTLLFTLQSHALLFDPNEQKQLHGFVLFLKDLSTICCRFVCFVVVF